MASTTRRKPKRLPPTKAYSRAVQKAFEKLEPIQRQDLVDQYQELYDKEERPRWDVEKLDEELCWWRSKKALAHASKHMSDRQDSRP